MADFHHQMHKCKYADITEMKEKQEKASCNISAVSNVELHTCEILKHHKYLKVLRKHQSHSEHKPV